jgi:hypothetical protein
VSKLFYQYLLTFLAFTGIIVGIGLVVLIVSAIEHGMDELKAQHIWFEKVYGVAKKVLTVIAYVIGGLLLLGLLAACLIDLHNWLWG